jgi:tRNA (guanine-N(7)-)-methyltransferase subunit TRM82
LKADNTLQHIQTVPLPGNALDAVVGPSNTLVVSVDCIHEPGSNVELRDSFDETTGSLQSYVFQNLNAISNSAFEEVEGEVEFEGEKALTRWTNLLYNLENLRKREEDAREEE